MCPPDYFAIRYEINPWMNRRHEANHALAIAEWTGLHDTLRTLGCEVEIVPPRPEWPDMVFTANAGLVSGREFISGSFRHRERQGESAWFEKWFREHDYDLVRLPGCSAFEGEGDALFCGGRLFCGHGFRTAAPAHAALAAALGCEVTSLNLVDPRFYHLDTCFCPLGESTAAWFPDAFDDAGQKAVRESIASLIDVSREESWRFACNSVVVGRHVVLPEGCPRFRAELTTRGFLCHEAPMGEFIKAGGACKCLVLQLSA
jgi:N-dimethylarginine dimethylaminohydrolase